ncbi:hypothetical protein [Gordonia sp. VNK21]
MSDEPIGGLGAPVALGMLAGFYLCVIVYSIGVKRIVKEHTAAQAK